MLACLGAVSVTAARAQGGPERSAPRRECPPTARLHVDDLFGFRMDVARLLELTGAAPVMPMIVREPSAEADVPVCAERAGALAWALSPAPVDSGVLRLRIVPITGELVQNTAYPRDRNNGALWAGVGPTLAVSGGLHARWRWLSAAFAPRYIRESNRAFDFPAVTQAGRSPFGYADKPGIDLPRRFGASPYTIFDPGQSYLRADAFGLAVGASTENVWIGPSQINPLMMSSTAPGFRHVFAGTSHPIATPIGRLEAQVIWGRLTESAYFDSNPANDRRLFSALVADWMPRWIPGLTVGGAYLYMDTIPPGGVSLGHEFRLAFPVSAFYAGGGNLGGDGLGALYARWVLPESGFEVYGEWAREDTPYDPNDLLAEPAWTPAYGLGFTQAVRMGPRLLRFYGELTHLGMGAPVRDGRGFFSYYTHSPVIQGLTQQGQLIGAALGPGSDGETLGLDLHYGRGMTGLWLERARYDDDLYYESFARRYGESRHDWELTGGLRQAAAVGAFELEASAGYSKRHNRDFLRLSDPAAVPLVEQNWQIDLRASYAPRLPWRRARGAAVPALPPGGSAHGGAREAAPPASGGDRPRP